MKAVSDLISPLSGEVLEVNQKVVDAPETVNEDPYGDGWLIRIRMTNPSERDQLLDARRVPQGPRRSSELSLAHGRRPRGDARGDRRRVDRGALPRHPGGRALRPRARRARPRSTEAELQRHLEELAAQERRRRGLLPRRRDLRPLRPRGRRRGAAARRAPDRVHAVPAGDEPGRPAGDLRVPDRDLRADRAWTSRTRRATTATTVAADACFVAKHATGRSKVVVTEATNPQVRQVVKTYAPGFGLEVVEVPHEGGATDPDRVREAADGRGRGDLPAAELLRRASRTAPELAAAANDAGRAAGRARRPRLARRARGARRATAARWRSARASRRGTR